MTTTKILKDAFLRHCTDHNTSYLQATLQQLGNRMAYMGYMGYIFMCSIHHGQLTKVLSIEAQGMRFEGFSISGQLFGQALASFRLYKCTLPLT